RRADADEVRLERADVDAVVLLQLPERRPGLPLGVHILPLVLADEAALRRVLARCIADAAGGADIGVHARLLRIRNPAASRGRVSQSYQEPGGYVTAGLLRFCLFRSSLCG